jgi:long-chain acyl-CoA synthetase
LEENIREIGPTVITYPPRLWESIMSSHAARMLDSSRLKRWAWQVLFPIGHKYAENEEKGIKPGLFTKLLHKIAVYFLFNRIKDKMGLSKLRSAWTGGAPLSPSCFGYFRAMGLPIKQLYGATEVAGVAGHYPDDVKWETLGRVARTGEVKISENGEILLSAVKIFSGYYKDPEKTKESLVDGRWFKTGDAGFINEDGHLIFLDRMDALMNLAGGKKYAPQYLEGRLKFNNYIKDVMVTAGKNRLYVTALINIDFENVGKWAELNRVSYTTYANLSQNDEVIELIKESIVEINKSAPPEARVKKFVNLPKEFDPDEGELTRTRKLRRSFIEERYEDLIEEMYDDKDEFIMNTEITYSDGRKDEYETAIEIITVEGVSS